MSLSEIRGEEALEALADILEPATKVLSDPKIVSAVRAGNRGTAIVYALRTYKKEILTILAIVDGEDPETYSPSLLQIPVKLKRLMEEPEMEELFTSQGQNTASASSGSAMESTEEADG